MTQMEQASAAKVGEEIRRFVLNNFVVRGGPEGLKDDDSFLERGVIDSPMSGGGMAGPYGTGTTGCRIANGNNDIQMPICKFIPTLGILPLGGDVHATHGFQGQRMDITGR